MITSEIFDIIKKAFPNSTSEITETTTANDVDEWDSLGHIMLIQAIEEKYQIQFDIDEMIGFNQVGDIIKAVKNKVS